VIDASNSIRAASNSSRLRPRIFCWRTFVLNRHGLHTGFDESPEVTQDFTSDLDKLRKGIKSIQPGGGTALWDAIYYACREKLLKQQESSSVRRAIILVSDGDDNQSRVLRKEAVEMAQRAEVIIYAISTSLMNTHEKAVTT